MEMFRFAHPEYLNGLVIIPILILLFLVSRRRRKRLLDRFGNREIVQSLMPSASRFRPYVKLLVHLMALFFLVIGIARPQFGSKLKSEKREGIELIIALDVSNSMLAEDIQPSRLDRAKRAITRLVDRLRDDKVGLIVFAGDAYTQLPITTDYASAKLFLTAVNTEIVPKQGTAIGAAIDLGMSSFTPKAENNKTLIIITDGENHEDDAIGAATAASEKGILVHTIGMGLPQGAPIPVYRNGQKDYRKDKDGNVIVTKLNETLMQQIAAAGKGIYVRANNAEVGLNKLFNEIEKMEKKEMESQVYADYEDQYQYFIGLGLLFFLLDFLILERKNRYLRNMKIFGSR